MAAIAIPRLTGFSESARQNAHEQNIKIITNAAAVYIAENGNPNPAVTDLDANTGIMAGYVAEWPTSPWANVASHASKDFVYKLSITDAGVITVDFEAK